MAPPNSVPVAIVLEPCLLCYAEKMDLDPDELLGEAQTLVSVH